MADVSIWLPRVLARPLSALSLLRKTFVDIVVPVEFKFPGAAGRSFFLEERSSSLCQNTMSSSSSSSLEVIMLTTENVFARLFRQFFRRCFW